MANLPNPNPDNASGKAAASDAKKQSFSLLGAIKNISPMSRKQGASMLAVLEGNGKYLNSLSEDISSLNTNFMDWTKDWSETVNAEAKDRIDAKRAARETAMEKNTVPKPGEEEKEDKKPGMLSGLKLPKLGIKSIALMAAAAVLAFVPFDKIIKVFEEDLLPALETFYNKGLVPFYEGFLKPIIEWFGDTGLPALGAAFMRSLTTLGDLFEGLGNVGQLLFSGDFSGAGNELINTLYNAIVDILDNALTFALELFGIDMGGKTVFDVVGDWFGDIMKSVTTWFKDNIYNSDTGAIFGYQMSSLGLGDSFSVIGTKVSQWIKDNIYDGDANTIFGYAIPEKLFDFAIFNFIKTSIDGVITSIKNIFAGDFSIENFKELFGSLFDIAFAGINLAVNAIKDIFNWGDPDKPFKLSEFIFGIIDSYIGFFTNKENTGIFDFSEPGEEFSIMGVIENLMKKVGDFFTNLFDIDFGAIAKKLVPDALKAVLPDSLFESDEEKKENQKKELQEEITNEQAYSDKTTRIIDNKLAKKSYDKMNSADKESIDRDRNRLNKSNSRIKESEAQLEALEPSIPAETPTLGTTSGSTTNDSTAILGTTSGSTAKTLEVAMGSHAHAKAAGTVIVSTPPAAAAAPVNGGGSSTTNVSSSSVNHVSNVALRDQVRPEQSHMRRFSAT
jgi:hypothetical protein